MVLYDLLDLTQMKLENTFGLILNGNLEEAQEALKLFEVGSNDVGRINVKRKEDQLRWKPLIKINGAMLSYATLLNKIAYNQSIGHSQFTPSQIDRDLATDACNSFREVIFLPNQCWDNFICKHVFLLNRFLSQKEAMQDLLRYSCTHLDNSNAHLYCLEFFRKSNSAHASVEKLACLRRLFKSHPFSEAGLELHIILKKEFFSTEDVNIGIESFEVIMSMLDDPTWSEELHVWQALLDILISEVKQDVYYTILEEVWENSSRSSWWPSFHCETNDKLLRQCRTSVFDEIKHKFIK